MPRHVWRPTAALHTCPPKACFPSPCYHPQACSAEAHSLQITAGNDETPFAQHRRFRAPDGYSEPSLEYGVLVRGKKPTDCKDGHWVVQGWSILNRMIFLEFAQRLPATLPPHRNEDWD